MVFTMTKYLLLLACLDFSLAPVSAQSDTFSAKGSTVRIFRKNDTTFSVTLSGQGAETEYVAVGLSTDLKMGGDAVIACTGSKIETYINQKRGQPSEKTNWTIGTPEKKESKKEGDIISCSFDLPSIITATKDISFDLNKMDQGIQYVLLARGELNADGTIMQHHGTAAPGSVTLKKTDGSSKVATPEPAGKFCLILLTIAGWYFYVL